MLCWAYDIKWDLIQHRLKTSRHRLITVRDLLIFLNFWTFSQRTLWTLPRKVFFPQLDYSLLTFSHSREIDCFFIETSSSSGFFSFITVPESSVQLLYQQRCNGSTGCFFGLNIECWKGGRTIYVLSALRSIVVDFMYCGVLFIYLFTWVLQKYMLTNLLNTAFSMWYGLYWMLTYWMKFFK